MWGLGAGKGVGSKRTDQLESFWGRFVVFLAGFGDISLLLVNWQVRGGYEFWVLALQHRLYAVVARRSMCIIVLLEVSWGNASHRCFGSKGKGAL